MYSFFELCFTKAWFHFLSPHETPFLSLPLLRGFCLADPSLANVSPICISFAFLRLRSITANSFHLCNYLSVYKELRWGFPGNVSVIVSFCRQRKMREDNISGKFDSPDVGKLSAVNVTEANKPALLIQKSEQPLNSDRTATSEMGPIGRRCWPFLVFLFAMPPESFMKRFLSLSLSVFTIS